MAPRRGGRWKHRGRCRAGQFFLVAGVVGETDSHSDGLSFVGWGQGVAGACSFLNFSVVGQPLVGEENLVQAVGVGDVEVSTVSVSPTRAVPLTTRSPASGVFRSLDSTLSGVLC